MAQHEQWRVDVDREIEQAWERFEHKLAQRLERLPDGRHFVLQTPRHEGDEDARPYVQVLSFDDAATRRCEVSSDDFLVPESRLGPAGEELYTALGFSPPSDDPADGAPNWWLHTDSTDCVALAGTIVRVLREAFGVVHPLLLEGMSPAPPGPDAHLSRPHHHRNLEPIDLDSAYPVSNGRQLASLIGRTLATITGEEIPRDENGDWPIPFDHHTAWVRILPAEPTIRVFAVLVHDIGSHRAAAREVAILNRDARHLRYVLDGEVLIAEVDVNAGPYVPGHLIAAIARMHRAAGQTASDFAARTGGSV